MATTVDTLKIAKRFKDAGLPEGQAEVFADVLRETRDGDLTQLATKADLASAEARLEAKIAEAKFDLLKWVVPLLAAQVVALIGLYFRG